MERIQETENSQWPWKPCGGLVPGTENSMWHVATNDLSPKMVIATIYRSIASPTRSPAGWREESQVLLP
jgi:hypothetical protein